MVEPLLVKARDIIPGWPRPKTTVSARGHWLYAETNPFMGGPRTAEMRDDLRRDAEYHRDQQQMVDDHFDSVCFYCGPVAFLQDGRPTFVRDCYNLSFCGSFHVRVVVNG